MTDYDDMSTDVIGNIFSDQWKDIHGTRPRHINFSDREALIKALKELMNE